MSLIWLFLFVSYSVYNFSEHIQWLHNLILFVFLPALYLDIFLLHLAEGFDECLSKTCIGHQRNIVVYCTTTDTITVCQLTFRVIFGMLTIRSNLCSAIIFITLFSACGRSSGQNTGVVGIPCELRNVAVPAVA